MKLENDIATNTIKEFLSVLKRFQKRIVNFENKGEVEITADLQDAVAGILNVKYGIHIAREFTMGRAIKKLGKQIYIYIQKRMAELMTMLFLKINILKNLWISIIY